MINDVPVVTVDELDGSARVAAISSIVEAPPKSTVRVKVTVSVAAALAAKVNCAIAPTPTFVGSVTVTVWLVAVVPAMLAVTVIVQLVHCTYTLSTRVVVPAVTVKLRVPLLTYCSVVVSASDAVGVPSDQVTAQGVEGQRSFVSVAVVSLIRLPPVAL